MSGRPTRLARGVLAAARRRRAGFSLLELLAATALFAVLAALLFQMMGGAGEVWARGQRVREAEESAAAVFDVLADDLRHLWAGSGQGGLLCGPRAVDGDGDGVPEQATTLLRFTRIAYEERGAEALRRTGGTPAAQQHATLAAPHDPTMLLPTGGLAESLYTTATLPGSALPTLVRRVRTPVGGAGSLLDPALAGRADRLLVDAVVLADRVLAFELRFLGTGETEWDDGPPRGWDSADGPGAGSAPEPSPGVAPGPSGAPSADVFPARAKVSLVLDAFGDDRLGAARLAEDVGAESATLLLASARLEGDDGAPSWLWIDGEWVAVLSRAGRQLTVRRGERGTRPVPHASGAVLRRGLLFERVVAIPAARERYDR